MPMRRQSTMYSATLSVSALKTDIKAAMYSVG